MSRVNRRDFLALAGLASLSLASPLHLSEKSILDENAGGFVDPWLEINKSHISWNVAQVRKRVENRPIMAVVKCNGYGHGLVEMAKILAAEKIQHFAVVKVHEAVTLRKNIKRGMILNFGPFSKPEAFKIVKDDISQSVFSDEVFLLVEAARKLKKQAKVHIKVDTGLGRVGVPYYSASSFIEKISAIPEIKIEGIFTTLTEETDFDLIQIERLHAVYDEAKKKGISLGIRHAASSLGIAYSLKTFLDMVRPGNCLYGLEELPNLSLKQAMTLKTRIIYVKKMKPGESIGYHRRYKIEKETVIATIPLGYEDGYPVDAVNKGQVLIHGQRFPLVGYMSANHVTIDVTGANNIKIGDEVVLIGNQNNAYISIDEVAKWGNSSVYKVPIMMNPFLPRVVV